MGLGFENTKSDKDLHRDNFTVDLLFQTEIHNPGNKNKKKKLLDIIKCFKMNGIEIPLFYHPTLHLLIVRYDETVSEKTAKKVMAEIKKINYEFEVYIKRKEVLDVEF